MPGRIRKYIFIALFFSAMAWQLTPVFGYVPGKPHDFSLDNPKGHCLNCHDPHSPNPNHGPYAHVLKRENEISVCYQCHAGRFNNFSSIDPTLTNVTSVYSPYDIRSEFTNQPGNIHFPSYGMDGEVNKCSECHNPHGIFNSNSTTKLPMLLSAGPNMVTGTYEYCLVCHNSDPNPPNPKFSNISVRSQFKFSRTVFQKMRHSTFGRATSNAYPHSYNTNPYGTGKDIACLTCHRPHGTSNQFMLKVPNDQNLCLSCHNAQAPGLTSFTSYHNGEYAPSLTSFTTSGHGKAALGGYKRICQDCHFPHGTGQKYAIYTTLTDPHTGGRNRDNIASQGINSACFACHGNRSSSGYYPGPTAYNSSMHKTSGKALNPNNIFGQASGDCDNCHNPHGTFGNYSRMLVGRKESLCFQCHNSVTPNNSDLRNISSEFQMNSHHKLSQVACKNCHNVHAVTSSSVMANPFSPASTITDIKTFCLKCHSGTTPAGVTGAPSISQEWTGNGHDRQHVLVCSDCHASHGSPNSKNLNYKTILYGGYSAAFGSRTALSFNKRKYCESCHNRVTTGFKGASTIPTSPGHVSQHNQNDTTPCSNCHTKAHNPLLSSYTGSSAFYTVYCLNCHTQGTGNPYPNVNAEFNAMASRHALTYNPPTTVDCQKCHGTHSNLSAANDVVDPDPKHPTTQSLNPNASSVFCLQCHHAPQFHDSTTISIGGQTPPNILDTYTAAGHGMVGVICAQCHEHHGSVNKKLIKQTINGYAVSSNYSGVNVTLCTACHKNVDSNLPYWPGYSTYSGSVHAYGNPTTGNLVTDGKHGRGVCNNCHNPHGSRVSGALTPYMNNKEGENLCFTCHASGFDNFSTPGDYNNKWNRFGTILNVSKQIDTSVGKRLAGLHLGQTGGQSISQNVSVWDGLVSSNAFPDNDAIITVKMKTPTYSFYAGYLTAGLRIEDSITSSDTGATGLNYAAIFYRMHTSPPFWICRYSGDSGPVGPNAFGDESANYHTLTIIRRKTFGTFSAYIDNIAIRGGTFKTSGYFKARLYCSISNNTSSTPEKYEGWFANFNVQYASGGSAHNTSSGDDVQARFSMKTHHKVADYDQTDGSKVECVDCHDPHTITEKKMGYMNISGSVRAVVADQNFCLKCHGNSPQSGVFFPRSSSTVWNKSLFINSAHGNPLKRYTTVPGQPGVRDTNYNNGVTYACKVCHNPHGSNQAHMQRDSWDINRDGIPDDINGDGILDSATQVGFIGYSTGTRKVMLVNTIAGIPSRASFQRISTTIPYQANGAIDIMLCLNCHDGKPAPDVKSEFMKASHHDVTFADQTAHGYSKIECYNCHDQHRAQARNDAAGEYPTTNPAGNREPMPGEAPFCLKCHNTNNGDLPPGVSGISFGRLKLKNIKLSYNPNNYTDAKGYDIITSSRQGHFIQSTGKALMCRTCHNQHGSNYQKLLRDDTEPGKTGYDSSQPIQNMRPVALSPADPFSGGDGSSLSATPERCLSCHSGKTTYRMSNGSSILLPIPPPPNSVYIGFTSLPEVGKHPDIKAWMSVGNGLMSVNGHLYSSSFAVSTSIGSVKDVCTMCHDSHNPYIPTVGDELMDCFRCHNANTSLPDVQSEFNANPLNPTRSKSYHPIKYDPSSPSGVECRKCHDQAKHMQGRVRLRKNPADSTALVDGILKFVDYTSEAQVWTSQPTSGGFVSDSTKPFANNSAISSFCLECHGRSSTVAAGFNGTDANGVTGAHNPPTLPFGIISGAHFTNGKLVCTNCHEYHGSVNTTLKRNTFLTYTEPTPVKKTQSLEGPAFCYGCHGNPAKSKDGIDIQFKFMSTVSHHQVDPSEQAANSSKVDCTDCHNPHVVTRSKSVVMADNTAVAAAATDSFCIACHDQNGKKGVQFPGFVNGTSGQEWNSATGAWNRWNKQAFTSSPHSSPGGLSCRNCHDPHGSSNYRMLLTNISSASGSGKNIKVSFGVHSTIRGKRTEEIGVNGVCAACHKNSMGNYSGNTVYPGYGSYTSMTFGKKSGVDKNCTYCHNPHGTSQTKFQNDTSALARMMRANKPLYMNMTSKNYGSIYNFKGFSNGTTGAPYYMFCSSRGCHASEKNAGNTFVTATESGKTMYDTFNLELPVDTFNKYATSSSHHPLKEGIINCNSCHREHGTSTKATDYVSPDLRAQYFRSSNWPKLWHGGIGVYSYQNGSLLTGINAENKVAYSSGPHGYGWYNDGFYYPNPPANYFDATPEMDSWWNIGSNAPTMAHQNQVIKGFENTTTPNVANNLCFMCHQQDDVTGTATNGMTGTNTKFLGHEAVKGGARMSHQLSPVTAIPASGEYHDYSCSACHFPHATSQNKLVKVSCFSQADGEYSQKTGHYSRQNAPLYGCHSYTSYLYNGTAYRGWRNLTTSSKTDFARPHNKVTDLSIGSIDPSALTVTLNWSAVADDQTSQKADHYNVYRYSSYIIQSAKPYAARVGKLVGSGGSNGNTGIGARVSFTDDTVQPNTTYYYAVVACDAQNNESFVSNCVSTTMGPDIVSPNSVSTQQLAQLDGTYNVRLTWNDPGDNVNVASYKIYRMANATSITNISQATYVNQVSDTSLSANGAGYPTDSNTYSYTDTTALTQGVQYAYAVLAVDQSNNASAVPTGQMRNITIVNPRPAAVSSLTVVPVSATMNMSLNWSAPQSVGGITSYNVYRDTQASMAAKTLVGSTNGTTRTYTDTVPATGVNYYYTVTAVNSSSTETPNESVMGVVVGPNNIMPPPTGLTATLGQNSAVSLSWTSGYASGGFLYYKIYEQLNSGSWTLLTTNYSTSMTVNLAGLQPGNYNFAVAGYYSGYEGTQGNYESVTSAPASVNVTDTVAPNAPVVSGALSSDLTHAVISWSAPSDNNYTSYGASGVNHYIIQASYNGGGTWTTLTSSYTALSYTDTTALTAGGTGMYKVQAVDNSNNVSVAGTVTVNARPSAITNLSVSRSSASAVNILKWSKSTSASGIAAYRVYAVQQSSSLNSSQLVAQNQIAMGNMTSYTQNVQYGNTWAFAVTAEDTYGIDSAISNSPVITDPPDKVTDLALSSPVHSSRVNMTWATPYVKTGAVTYQVYRLPTSVNNTPTAVTYSNYTTQGALIYTGTYASGAPGTFNNYSDISHNGGPPYPNDLYYYAVRSSDASGNWSLISNSPGIVVGQDTTPPVPPTITGAKAAYSEVDIYWNNTTDPDDQISKYALYRGDASLPPFSTDGGITPNNIGSATVVSNQIPGAWFDVDGNPTQPVWPDHVYDATHPNGPLPGHTYYYALAARDTAYNWSAPSTNFANDGPVVITVPTAASVTSPPTWVSPADTLTVTGFPAVDYPDIDLIWTPAVDNGPGQAGSIDHYAIYRSTQPFSSFAGMSSIAWVAPTSSSYVDHTGNAGTTYYYGITAVDSYRNASVLSNVTSATVGSPPCTDSGRNYPTVNNIPTIPGGFTAATGAYPYINLSWTASTDVDDCNHSQPLQCYKLYYAASGITIPDNADTMTADSLNANGIYTMILDNTLMTPANPNYPNPYRFRGIGGSGYNFRLEAYDLAGNKSGLSSQVAGQVAAAPCTTTNKPTAPGNFSAVVGPAPDMDFSWSASAVGGCSGSNLIDHYNLYRNLCTLDGNGNLVPGITASTALSSITPIRISGSVTSYIDSTGKPNTWYSYVLTAVDSMGNESAMSAIVTKQTEADNIAPAAINSMKATPITSGGGGIQLYWCKPSDNVGVDHYDIYRVQQSTIMLDSQLTQTNKIGSSYNTGACVTWNDGGNNSNNPSSPPVSGLSYSYAAIAVDAAGNRSTISKGVSPGDTICTAP